MISKPLIIIILITFLVIVLYVLYRKNFKTLVIGTIVLITGAVKVGKSLLSTWIARTKYRARHRKWWIATHVFKQKIEEPLFYTNAYFTFGNGKKKHKLDKNIRLIELEHLLREKRFNYKSVCYIQEASLMSDNMDIASKERNAQLSMFNKLFGHETKGGLLIYDTQSILDAHYSIKRVVGSFFFIQKSLNLFLFRVLYVREMINLEIGVNTSDDDLDTTTRKVLIGCWNYKHYDQYYYSYLTDKLPKKTRKPKFYKGGLISFNPLYRELSLRGRKEKKNEEKIV